MVFIKFAYRKFTGVCGWSPKQHGQQRMVTQPLVGAMPGPCTQRLGRGRQADFIEPREAFPGGRWLGWRLDTLRGAAQGEQGGKFLVQPAREVAYGSVNTRQRGLRQLLPLQRFQERLGHRDKPRIWPIMVVEVLVEGQKALEVAAFGVEGGLRMPSRFRHQVDGGEFRQAVFLPVRCAPKRYEMDSFAEPARCQNHSLKY